jgi:hypothetical protein
MKLEFAAKKIYEDVRGDGAPIMYFFLETPVDPKKQDYKFVIKGFIATLNQHPELQKYSAYFYDDRACLELHYRHYTAKLGRLMNEKEIERVSRHCIAAYDRGQPLGKTPNSLASYPATISKHKAYRYFEEFEYNPLDGKVDGLNVKCRIE